MGAQGKEGNNSILAAVLIPGAVSGFLPSAHNLCFK